MDDLVRKTVKGIRGQRLLVDAGAAHVRHCNGGVLGGDVVARQVCHEGGDMTRMMGCESRRGEMARVRGVEDGEAVVEGSQNQCQGVEEAKQDVCLD